MSEYIARCTEVVGISGKALIFPDYIDTSKEIVRCGDCKFYRFDHGGTCEKIVKYPIIAHVEPDGFCSWGKRRNQ